MSDQLNHCECACSDCVTGGHCDRASCAQPDFNPRWMLGPGTWTIPPEPFAMVPDSMRTGVDSIDAALNEYIDATIAFTFVQVQALVLTDASIAIHEVCCIRRLMTAAAALDAELQKHAASTLSAVNYDDATMAELLGGIQG